MVTYSRSRKPKTYRKKPYRKTNVSKAVKKYVKRIAGPRPELKCLWYNEKEYNLDTLANQSYVYNFSQLAQGTNRYSRIGNQVLFKGVHIKGAIKNNVAKTNYVRMIVASCNGSIDLSVAGYIEIFAENLAGTGAGTSTITGLEAMYAALNKTKFKIHCDKKFRLGATGSVDGADTKLISKFVKFNQSVRYEGNTYGQDNQNRQMFALFIAAEAADDSVGGVVELSHTTRSWFTDV